MSAQEHGGGHGGDQRCAASSNARTGPGQRLRRSADGAAADLKARPGVGDGARLRTVQGRTDTLLRVCALALFEKARRGVGTAIAPASAGIRGF